MDMNHSIDELGKRINESWMNTVSVRADLDRALLAIDRLEERLLILQASFATAAEAQAETSRVATLWETVELSFQEEFRGPSDLIKERLSAYLSDVLAVVGDGGDVLDIGCGRGDWLELLLENGISATGVDTDPGSVARCADKGLDVRLEDAGDFLASAESDSHAVVTAFHVVEHLPLEGLMSLLREALRILRPGGVLIMETPNPQNFLVATHNFFLDPTHIRPIPPALLSFLAAELGFVRVEARFLHRAEASVDEAEKVKVEMLPGPLRHALTAAADYAVIAFR